MYVILSVYLSKIIIHLFAGMSVRLYGSVYLTSVYLSVCLSVRILSICLSVSLSIERERESNMDIVTFLHDIQINGDCDLSIYLSVSLTLSIHLTI